MKKISVIVPVYNTEKYIGRCIESIQTQTYSNLEIILVDDGSDDNSFKVCCEYAEKDSRIKVFHKDNSGVSSTRNMGIEEATGDYIGFVDSDDYIEPEMYEDLLSNVKEKSMPICAYHIVDENGKIIGKKSFDNFSNEIMKDDFFILCENIMLNSPVNKLYETKVIKDKNIRFNTELSLGEDFLFVLDYIENIDRFKIIDKSLYNYMVFQRDSLSQIYRKDFFEIQRKLILKIKQLLEEKSEFFIKYKKRFYTFTLDLFLQSLNNTISDKSSDSAIKQIKRNNQIMQDCIFEECLENANLDQLDKLYVLLLKTKRFELVFLYKKVFNLVKKIWRKKMIRLYYHGGSGNHGCEAIVRGTNSILNQNLILYSMRIEEDRVYGLDEIVELKIDKINKISKNSLLDYFCRLHSKLTKSSEFRTKIERKDFLKDIKSGDICLSIGGDNYCYAGYETLSDLNSLIKKRGGKTVLWGCSVETSIVNEKTKKDFQRYDLVIARESITYQTLKKINKNTKLFPDPAFALGTQEMNLPENFEEGNTIGINLSPLIVKNEKQSGLTLKNYERLIEYILKETNYKIALIPHVVWQHDNDIDAIAKLYEKYQSIDRVLKIVEGNAMQLKYCISKCKMFIGARTHSTIAAYSSCVPTIVIGYSVKANGIAKDLFGTDENYVIPVQSIENEDRILNGFKWLDLNYDKIKIHLENLMPKYIDKVWGIKSEIEELV